MRSVDKQGAGAAQTPVSPIGITWDTWHLVRCFKGLKKSPAVPHNKQERC